MQAVLCGRWNVLVCRVVAWNRSPSGVVRRRGHAAPVARPVGVDELARLGQEFVGVRPKVVALSLDEVGRQHRVSVPIVERESSGKAGHGNACLDTSTDGPPPGVLAVFHS